MKRIQLLCQQVVLLLFLLSACGSGDDLDFSIQFTGALRQSGSPVAGRVCAFGECAQSTSDGRFNFKAYDEFRGGAVAIFVHFNGIELSTTINLPGNAEEVSLQLSIDNSYEAVSVESLQVVRIKQVSFALDDVQFDFAR